MSLSSNDSPLRVAVIGGGLAGPLAALAIHQFAANCHVTVYEAYADCTSGNTVGAWLTLAPNGLRALTTLGVDVTKISHSSDGIDIMNENGWKLGTAAFAGGVAWSVRRHELYALIRDTCLQHDVVIKYRHKLTSYDKENKCAYFETDKTSSLTKVEADLFIGADGVHSVMRASLFPTAQAPLYSGLTNIGGFSPLCEGIPTDRQYRMYFGRECFFGFTLDPSRAEVLWFANVDQTFSSIRDVPADDEGRKALLLQLLSGECRGMTICRKIVECAKGKIVWTPQYDLPLLQNWCSPDGTALLIGDAAHAANPASGQGVSLAAEDAVMLGLALRDSNTLLQAVKSFVTLRKKRCEAVIAMGKQMSSGKMKMNYFQRKVRNVMMRILFKVQPSRGWLVGYDIPTSRTVGELLAAANEEASKQQKSTVRSVIGVVAVLSAVIGIATYLHRHKRISFKR